MNKNFYQIFLKGLKIVWIVYFKFKKGRFSKSNSEFVKQFH